MLTVDVGSIPSIAKKLNQDEIIGLNQIFKNPVILESLETLEKRRKIIVGIKKIFLILLIGMGIIIFWKLRVGNTIFEKLLSGFFNQFIDIIFLIGYTWFMYVVIDKLLLIIKMSFKTEIYTSMFPLFGPDFLFSNDGKYGFDVPYELWGNFMRPVSYSTQYKMANIQINSEEYAYPVGKETRNYFTSKVIFHNFRIPTKTSISINEEFMGGVDVESLIYGFFTGFFGFIISSHYFGIKGLFLGIFIGGIIYFITSGYNKRQILLENIEFEKLFDVISDDQVLSRMIITPAFMDRMTRFSKNTGRSGYRFKFQSNILYIGREIPNDYYYISTERNFEDNINHLVQFYIDTKENILLIKELNLVYLSPPGNTITNNS